MYTKYESFILDILKGIWWKKAKRMGGLTNRHGRTDEVIPIITCLKNAIKFYLSVNRDGLSDKFDRNVSYEI